MEHITSARDLSRYLAERFRRDGFFRGPRFVDKGELIIPLCPALEKLRQSFVKSATSSQHDFADAVASMCEGAILFGSPMYSAADRIAGMVGKQQAIRATYKPVDPAAFASQFNVNTDDWYELTDVALKAERKANRALERALKRSRRNSKNPKKKGKCR